MSPQMSGLVSSIACSLLVAIISTLVSIKVSAAQVWSAVAPSMQTVNHTRTTASLLCLHPIRTPPTGRWKSAFRVDPLDTVCLTVARRWPALSSNLQ